VARRRDHLEPALAQVDHLAVGDPPADPIRADAIRGGLEAGEPRRAEGLGRDLRRQCFLGPARLLVGARVAAVRGEHVVELRVAAHVVVVAVRVEDDHG
jgi:hypothetical protein